MSCRPGLQPCRKLAHEQLMQVVELTLDILIALLDNKIGGTGCQVICIVYLYLTVKNEDLC